MSCCVQGVHVPAIVRRATFGGPVYRCAARSHGSSHWFRAAAGLM